MNSDLVLSLLHEMLKVGAVVAGPLVLAGLVVGLLVSILQVVTQIQEMSLTFVPKIVVMAFILMVLGGWMLAQLVQFATQLFVNIPQYIQ
ncbi:MAG: flagellar biosynthetic protein FliQ [Hyphomonadaceae bacterium]|nr:flagellar biosynthetic protein FliQ [Hyphomonadaceae bacterium]